MIRDENVMSYINDFTTSYFMKKWEEYSWEAWVSGERIFSELEISIKFNEEIFYEGATI